MGYIFPNPAIYYYSFVLQMQLKEMRRRFQQSPTERERSSAAERSCGVSEGESGEEEKFVLVLVQTLKPWRTVRRSLLSLSVSLRQAALR